MAAGRTICMWFCIVQNVASLSSLNEFGDETKGLSMIIHDIAIVIHEEIFSNTSETRNQYVSPLWGNAMPAGPFAQKGYTP